MTDEKTEDENRVNCMRMGMQVLNALLFEQFGKQYNLIVIAAPAGEKVVSLVTRCESDDATDGMISCAVNALHSSASSGVMQ
jgi:hypothetical protein